jgi:hypothetical protein
MLAAHWCKLAESHPAVQNVTLGGTGKEVGDRHPKIGVNVLIGAGASVLGNITVGTGAQVAAGSLVLKPVEAHTMVAGSPAKCVGAVSGNPAASLKQWSEECPMEGDDADVDRYGRRPTRVGTGAGGVVRVYTEGDYYRHIDAEKAILYEDVPQAAGAVPVEWSSTVGRVGADQAGTEPSKEKDAAVRDSVLQQRYGPDSAIGRVESTTSDAIAEAKWGGVKTEPEFFI